METYLVIRVDSGKQDIVSKGSFEEAIKTLSEKQRESAGHIYIVRSKAEFEKRKGGVL